MGKKNREENQPAGRKGRGGRTPFTLLGEVFENPDTELVRSRLFFIILVSVVAKILVLVLTTGVFHSFIDLFDFQYYLEHGAMMAGGKIPYLDFAFDYPPLAIIPILLAMIPAAMTASQYVFVFSFQALMVICDCVTAVCIYFIGLKIYDEKKAFTAALIYAAAFSAAYFVLTKYDAFPACILMVALLFTIYGMGMKGYLADIAGILAKIFPGIALPFMVLYNAKKTSLKEEIHRAARIIVPLAVVVAVPALILNPEILTRYFTASLVRSSVYANTPTYTVYAVLNGILGIAVPVDLLSNLMYVVMGILLLLFLWAGFTMKKMSPAELLALCLVSVFTVVFFMKYHSPQYLMWYTPLVCLLVADRMYAIVLFFIAQALTYIEFPLLFGSFYTNAEYVSPAGTAGYVLTAGFFCLEYLVLVLLILVAVSPVAARMKKALLRPAVTE